MNLILFIVLAGAFFFVHQSSFAQENTEDLKAQIQALQKRVEELEAREKNKQTPRALPHHPFTQRGWDPFAQMQRMQEEMDALFSDAFSMPTPGARGMFSTDMVFDQELDLKETDAAYEIRFNMSGLNKEKMDIQINKHSITVSGQYSEKHQEDNPGGVIQSQRFGTFLKTIPLPVDADTASVKTEQQGDELVITMPKK